MAGTAPSAAEPPLTRRQIREAERAREAAAAAARPVVPAAPASAEPTPASAAPVAGSAPAAAVPALPTRRQLREAARRAEAAHHEAVVRTHTEPPRLAPATIASHGPASAPTPAQAPLADTADTAVLRPLPSRHELRAAQRRRHHVPRPFMVAGLAAVVVAAPLTGFATGTHSAQAMSTAAAVTPVATQPNVLEVLEAGTTDVTTAGSALMANPTAAARAAAIASSRASERQELDSTHLTGANGEVAAFVREDVVMPLAAGTYRNTSGYGERSDPFTGRSTMHYGSDFAAPLGTPIHAVADGVVDYVGEGKDGRSSMLIVLRHEIGGETVYTWYNHMFADGLLVEEGELVAAGDVIAEVGNNGRSTGPHLHFEVHLDDELTTTEPLAWLAANGAVDVSEL